MNPPQLPSTASSSPLTAPRLRGISAAAVRRASPSTRSASRRSTCTAAGCSSTAVGCSSTVVGAYSVVAGRSSTDVRPSPMVLRSIFHLLVRPPELCDITYPAPGEAKPAPSRVRAAYRRRVDPGPLVRDTCVGPNDRRPRGNRDGGPQQLSPASRDRFLLGCKRPT